MWRGRCTYFSISTLSSPKLFFASRLADASAAAKSSALDHGFMPLPPPPALALISTVGVADASASAASSADPGRRRGSRAPAAPAACSIRRLDSALGPIAGSPTGRRADEDDAGVGAGLGEFVLGQEAVAGMDRLRAREPGDLEDVAAQVDSFGAAAADVRLVAGRDMHGAGVGFGEHRDGLDAHAARLATRQAISPRLAIRIFWRTSAIPSAPSPGRPPFRRKRQCHALRAGGGSSAMRSMGLPAARRRSASVRDGLDQVLGSLAAGAVAEQQRLATAIDHRVVSPIAGDRTSCSRPMRRPRPIRSASAAESSAGAARAGRADHVGADHAGMMPNGGLTSDNA